MTRLVRVPVRWLTPHDARDVGQVIASLDEIRPVVRHGRMVVERIEVTVQGQTERVQLAITWSGGFVSRHAMIRAVSSYAHLADYPRLLARIEQLRGEGKSMDDVAATLNAEGFLPPRRVTRFSGGMVAGLLARKYANAGAGHGERVAGALKQGEWL